MDNIWKTKSNTHICNFCYNYIDTSTSKSFFKKTNNINKNIQCYTCNRNIYNIINGPNIIEYIEDNRTNNDFFIIMNKYKSWYFNDIYDNFGYYLKQKFKLSHNELKNIYQSINDLQALPNINIINEKIDDLINYNKI